MLIETNRLHQKIKKLKEELAKEKELRKEAERMLRVFKESSAATQKIQLEMTEATNIGLVIRSVEVSTVQPQNNSSSGSTTSRSLRSESESSTTLVSDFLIKLFKAILNQEIPEVFGYYKEYKKSFTTCAWPTLDYIEQQIGSENKVVLSLFKELNLRKSVDSVPDSNSWNTYLGLMADRNSLKLPNIWTWDIINEFIYRYQCHQIFDANTDSEEAWRKGKMIECLSNQIEGSDSFGYFAFIGLLRIHTFLENHQEVTKLVSQYLTCPEKYQMLDSEDLIYANYEIGFTLMISGKPSEAVNIFMKILYFEKNEEMSSIRKNTEKCIGFCISNDSKIKKIVSKNILSSIEISYRKLIENWKDGKIEAYWNFLSECSPYINRRKISITLESEWTTHNFKSIKFSLQRITTWKPLRNLKGLLKVMEIVPLAVIQKSIFPVTNESDIKFFCDNNNGLNRLVNSKTSAIERVLGDFPNIHRKETLTLLIMQYHKILLKQKNEDKVLAFGRKFVMVLKAIGYTGRINLEDAMCYIREVSKISMEDANKLVEDQCKF